MAESQNLIASVSRAFPIRLAHVPDLVRFGSKPLRELRGNPALAGELARLLRDFPAATAYAPHQVYIGNIGPESCAICRSLGTRN